MARVALHAKLLRTAQPPVSELLKPNPLIWREVSIDDLESEPKLYKSEVRQFRSDFQLIFDQSQKETTKQEAWIERLLSIQAAAYEHSLESVKEFAILHKCLSFAFARLAELTDLTDRIPPINQILQDETMPPTGPQDTDGTDAGPSNRRVACRIEKFKGNSSEDFARWLARFDIMCIADGIVDDTKKAAMMPTYFEQNAFEYYIGLDETTRTDYASLRASLKEQFISPEQEQFTQLQVASRKQGPNETVSEFETEIRALGKRAYPALAEQDRNRVMMGHFIGGLRSHYQKQMMVHKVKNFTEAVQMALKFEMVQEMDGHGPGEKFNAARRNSNRTTRAVQKSGDYENESDEGEAPQDTLIGVRDTLEKISASNARIETKLSEHDKLHMQHKERADASEATINRRLDKVETTINTSNNYRGGNFQRAGPSPNRNFGPPNSFNKNSGGPIVSFVCWRCNQKGHISRDCPQSRQAPQSAPPSPTPRNGVANIRGRQPPNRNNGQVRFVLKENSESESETETEEINLDEIAPAEHGSDKVYIARVQRTDIKEIVPPAIYEPIYEPFPLPEPDPVIYTYIIDISDINNFKVIYNAFDDPHYLENVQDRPDSPGPEIRRKFSKILNPEATTTATMAPKPNKFNKKPKENDSKKSSRNGIISFTNFLHIISYMIMTLTMALPWVHMPLEQRIGTAIYSTIIMILIILPRVLRHLNLSLTNLQYMKPRNRKPWKSNLTFHSIRPVTFHSICDPTKKSNSAIRILAGIPSKLSETLTMNKTITFMLIFCALVQVGSTGTSENTLEAVPYKAPNPMVCGTSTLKDIWKIPRQMPCKISQIRTDQTPRTTTMLVYKHNFVEYQSKAWHCTKIRSQKRVYSRFFRDHFFHEQDISTQLVSESDCDAMKKDHECPLSENLWKESNWNDDNFNPKKFSTRLTRKNEMWQTKNSIPDFWPYGGHWCCKWHKRTVENCYQYDTFVYKRFGDTEIMSPIGDVAHCRYKANGCQLSDGSYIKWENNPKANCEYIPWKQITGKRWSNNFMAEDNSIGLTFPKAKPFPGCNNQTLFMSDQGIPVEILDVNNWLLGLPDLIPFNEWDTESLLDSLQNLKNKKYPRLPPNTINQNTRTVYEGYMRDAYFFEGAQREEERNKRQKMTKKQILSRQTLSRLDEMDQILIKYTNKFRYMNYSEETKAQTALPIQYRHRRSKQGTRSPTYVTSDHLAGALQGIWLTMSEHLRFTFEQAMQVTCNNINMMMKLLYTQILENPTLAMRQLFGNDYLIARAGGEMVEIQPCHEITLENVRFIPMETQLCTEDIPVQYRILGVSKTWREGYLDPLTKQIKRSSLETDCELVQMLPLQLGTKYYIYNANRTGIREIKQLPEALFFETNSTIKFRIEPHVVRHLKMYNFSDFQSALTSNQLLRAANQLNDIYGQHGFRPRNYNDTYTITGSGSEGQNPMADWWSSSPFAGYFKQFTDHAYQIWMFAVGLYVTFGWAASCCFPEGFGAKINMRELASKAKEKYEARKQRVERQKLDVADARATELIELANQTLLSPEEQLMNQHEHHVARVRFSYNRLNPVATFEKLAEVIHRLQDKLAQTQNDSAQQHVLEQGITAAKRQVLALSMDVCSGADRTNESCTYMEDENCMDIYPSYPNDSPFRPKYESTQKCEELQHEISRIASAPMADLLSDVRIGQLPDKPGMYPEIPTGNTERKIAVIWNDTRGKIPPPISLYVHVTIGTSQLIVLWDTGAQMSLIPLALVERLGLTHQIKRTPITASGIAGTDLSIQGRIKLLLNFTDFNVEPNIFKAKPDESVTVPHYFEVTDCEAVKVALMGLDFAALFTSHEVDMPGGLITFTWDKNAPTKRNYNIKMSCAQCPLTGLENIRPSKVDKVQKLQIFATLQQTEKSYGELRVMEPFVLAPRSVLYIPCAINDLKSGRNNLMFIPSETYKKDHRVVITRQYLTRAVIREHKLDEGEPMYVMAVNANCEPIKLAKGTCLGQITSGKCHMSQETKNGERVVHQVTRGKNNQQSFAHKEGTSETSQAEKEKCLKDLGFKPTKVKLSD